MLQNVAQYRVSYFEVQQQIFLYLFDPKNSY